MNFEDTLSLESQQPGCKAYTYTLELGEQHSYYTHVYALSCKHLNPAASSTSDTNKSSKSPVNNKTTTQ